MVNITIIGTGYIGLVSGACLADFGNTVVLLILLEQLNDAGVEGHLKKLTKSMKNYDQNRIT